MRAGSFVGDRVAPLHVHPHRGAVRGGDALGDAPQAGVDVVAHRLVERADRPDEARAVRDDVVAHARLELADGDDRGLVGDVERARHDRLERRHDLAADDDRVDRGPRLRAVRLPALDRDLEPVGGGEEGAAAVAEDAALQLREDVQAEDGLDPRVVEDALLHHQLGPRRLLGERHALLGGLEDEENLPRQSLPHRHEGLRGVEQHRDVRVVATRVHDPDRLSFPGRGRPAGEGQVDLLGDRQRVHVGAQRDDRPRPAALDHGDDAGLRHAGPRTRARASGAARPRTSRSPPRGSRAPGSGAGAGATRSAAARSPRERRRSGPRRATARERKRRGRRRGGRRRRGRRRSGAGRGEGGPGRSPSCARGTGERPVVRGDSGRDSTAARPIGPADGASAAERRERATRSSRSRPGRGGRSRPSHWWRRARRSRRWRGAPRRCWRGSTRDGSSARSTR